MPYATHTPSVHPLPLPLVRSCALARENNQRLEPLGWVEWNPDTAGTAARTVPSGGPCHVVRSEPTRGMLLVRARMAPVASGRSSCILPSYRATSGHLGPPIPSGWAAPVPLSLAMHLLCQWRRSHWHTLCMKRAAKGLTRRYGDYGCNSLRSLDLRVYDGCPTKRHSFDGPKSCQHAHFGDSAVRIVTQMS